jgi:pyrroloquinoline quinone biosynthesis protein D
MYAVRSARRLATPESKPFLPRYIRLRYDQFREKHVILGPEKVYWPDEISADILQLCDGQRDVAAIAKVLAVEYNAPEDVIRNDILEFVQEWSDNLMLKL